MVGITMQTCFDVRIIYYSESFALRRIVFWATTYDIKTPWFNDTVLIMIQKEKSFHKLIR